MKTPRTTFVGETNTEESKLIKMIKARDVKRRITLDSMKVRNKTYYYLAVSENRRVHPREYLESQQIFPLFTSLYEKPDAEPA